MQTTSKKANKAKVDPNTMNPQTAIQILKLLSEGLQQKEVPAKLQEAGQTPNSLRSVEDYLNQLQKLNKCTTLFQLMYKYGRRHKIKTN